MYNELISIALATTALLILWYFWFFAYTPLKRQKYRAAMFELRHKLFMYAAEGNIGFDSKAYSYARERINTSIRYTHKLNLANVTMLMVYVEKYRTELVAQSAAEKESAFNALSSEQADFIRQAMDEMHWKTISLIVSTSLLALPFLALLLLAFQAVSTLKSSIKKYVLDKYSDKFQEFDKATIEIS